MGPVSCAFSSWAPEGALLGSGCSSWLLDSTHYISILSFPEAYCRGQLSCDGLMAEIFFTYWYQFSSVSQSCPTLCKPMDSSMPGLPIHHQLQEFTRTHIHWVSDVIQPSHPVVSFSSHLHFFPASRSFQMSQFFISDGQSIGVSASTSVLPMNIQDWFPFGLTSLISLQSKGLARVLSNPAVQKHHFFGACCCCC